MNARTYRVDLSISPLDFPSIMGLGESLIFYQSEPHLNGSNLILTITKKYILKDIDTGKEYEVLSVKSDYEIPTNLIKIKQDVYEFYKDATKSLNEAFQFTRTLLEGLPNIQFPIPPIENYKGEIDRVFNLLDSRN